MEAAHTHWELVLADKLAETAAATVEGPAGVLAEVVASDAVVDPAAVALVEVEEQDQAHLDRPDQP